MTMKLEDFVQGLRHTFETLVGADLQMGPVESCPHPMFADISAHLPLLNGEPACVVLTMTKRLAVRLVGEISGEKLDFDDALVADAVGELLNMAVGATQRHSGTPFNYSLPIIVKGEHHEIRVVNRGHTERLEASLGDETLALFLVRGVSENVIREVAVTPA
jgi:CheY-specific phosphatase CheX